MAQNVPKFPIIGGPLDGEYANNKDFQDWQHIHGQFAEYRSQYLAYNNASGYHHPDRSSMIWIHRALVPQKKRLPQ